MTRTHTPQPWCSGPMIAVFDAALDGDEGAIASAISVCHRCPLLDTCAQDRERRRPRDRWGVMAGLYERAALPPSLLAPEVTADDEFEVPSMVDEAMVESIEVVEVAVQDELFTWEPAELQLAEPMLTRTTRHLAALPKSTPAMSQPALIDWASDGGDCLVSLAAA